MRSKAANTPPKITKLDLKNKVTGAASLTGGTGTNNTNSYEKTASGEGENDSRHTYSKLDPTAQSFDKDMGEIAKAVHLQYVAGENKD